MSPREAGFRSADIASDLFGDPKVKRLGREYPHLFAEAMVVYLAVLLDSWRSGSRVTADDSWPLQLPAEHHDEILAALSTVGLIDRKNLIPSKAWASWFGPAQDRKQQRIDAGRLGGRQRVANERKRRSSASQAALEAEPEPSLSPAQPDPSYPFPSVPTDPSVPSDDAPADGRIAYCETVGRYPTTTAGDWIDRLAREHGVDAFRAALATEHLADSSTRTLLSRTESRLAIDRDRRERRERAAKQREGRKPVKVIRAKEPEPELTQEEIDRQVAQYRAGIKAEGGAAYVG